MKKFLAVILLSASGFVTGAEWHDKWGHTMRENEIFRQGALFGLWNLGYRWNKAGIGNVNNPTWNVKEWMGHVKEMGWLNE